MPCDCVAQSSRPRNPFRETLPSPLLDVFDIERGHVATLDVVETDLNVVSQRKPTPFSLRE